MTIIDVLPYIFTAYITLLLEIAIVYYLDIPIINNWFGLDRRRRKVAEELKLSLTNDKDRERINKKMALYDLTVILYIVFAGVLIYFILIPQITEWLN